MADMDIETTTKTVNGEVDLETAMRIVQEHQQQERQARIEAFMQEYRALCQKYGVELVAGLTLKDLVRQ